MRAIWKGHIRFSLVTIPIRIYSAIDTEKTISFNQLSKEHHNPVKYDKQDKVTGESLSTNDIVKGYQYEPGHYVIIEQEDLDNIKIKSSKVIEIEGFVEESEIHPMLYDQPYFIGPDGDVAAKTYGLLMKTLEKSKKIGVGRVVLRDRESLVLLRPYQEGMVLYKLRNPREIRDISDVPKIDEVDSSDKDQLKMAMTLVDSMTKKFADINTTDHYYEALRSMIDAKIEGKEIVTYNEEEPEVVDIMTALKESIARAKSEKKPMRKAGSKTAAEKTKRKTGS
ncbi:Ku protein [Fulvivirga sedimenti]|uniref:Non-homologous end joining protein Ku n=1 Tax=Fulvivirga sedimenti TaxID=2879465 RepID=A0A9X1HVV7_9BACT|nr:Ku protein [Fulvivirga sedimenti]MCA6078885.1 Ku protein [Fulvivirga sedimenti]